jgi:hypothetical protein
MDPISHIAFSYILNLGHGNLWLIIGSVILDIDKIFTYVQRKFKGHESRTFLSELPFVCLLIGLSTIFNKDFAFGIISHYMLDFLVGETKPFNPFQNNIVNFNLKTNHKIVLGAIIWLIGGILYTVF